MEALEAHVLPSSRLANEAACTTIRFIQASASPPLPLGHELRLGVYSALMWRRRLLRNYTFRSMPRRPAADVQPGHAREAPRTLRPRKPTGPQAWTRRLSKRVVPKADGRYLIYYEKS